MVLGALPCQWVPVVQCLPLYLSCRGGRASLGIPCPLWLLEDQGSLLGLEVPLGNLFPPFLLLDQEFHHVLGSLSYPLVPETLGILEVLEALFFLESQGSL